VLAAAAALSGCSRAPEDVSAKYRAVVLPKLEAVVRLYEPASAKESLTALLPDAAVEGLDFSSDPTSNAILVQHEELADLKAQPEIELCLDKNGPIHTAKDVLGLLGSRVRAVSDYEDEDLQQLARAKYALVVFVRSTNPLHVDMSFDDERFTPRAAKGSAILFDIDKAEAVGGFEFTATNSPEIQYREGSGKKEEAVRKDLIRQVGAAVKEGVVKRFPGAKPPTIVVLP
jgi:hypothetical protein